jgi:hypothetical protein
MFIHPRQPVAFFNARFTGIATEEGGDNYLVFEYQGQEMRQPTFPGSGNTELSARAVGKFGVVVRVDWQTEGRDFPHYRFDAYLDQSLRRAFELDVFEATPPVGSASYSDGELTRCNVERIGWRNSLCPDGFLAPAGIIPGTDGRFIQDETEALTIDIPPEFVSLCDEYKSTPMQVLRGFIADAASLHNYMAEPRADGYSSNGSDERMLAYDYIERAYGMRREFDGS